MLKVNQLKNNRYVFAANKIREELNDSFLYEYLNDNFQRLDKLVTKPLKLAVFGEFNAGKTTFINKLLSLSLPTKRVPTTKVITLIKYSTKEKFEIEYKDKNSEIEKYSIREYEGLDKLNEVLENESDLIEIKEIRIYINNDILKTFEIIDTPGFNDVEFEKITKTLFDRVNFAIWIFSAHQVGSATEKSILEEFKIKSIYKNNIYAFINQADIVKESEIINIQNSLQEHKEYFMNKNILAISAKKQDDIWNAKFNNLINDLKSKVLNRDIEISALQIEDEFEIIKTKLRELNKIFSTTKEEIIQKLYDYLKKYPTEYPTKKLKKQNIIEIIQNNIIEIKEDIKDSELYKKEFLETGIKFLTFYKTIDKLDSINNTVKKVYIEYINEFKKDFEENIQIIFNLLDNLIVKDNNFYESIHKKFDKILFTLDTLRETKQLLIVGYIIGILTDDYIYKNLKEKDILKNLNKDVISNLIDLDLDISYFIDGIERIREDIKSFFDIQITLLNQSMKKE